MSRSFYTSCTDKGNRNIGILEIKYRKKCSTHSEIATGDFFIGANNNLKCVVSKELNNRQKEYCKNRALGFSQHDSYIKAGYKENTGSKDAAYKLEKQPEIKAEIERLKTTENEKEEREFLWNREIATKQLMTILHISKTQLEEQAKDGKMSAIMVQAFTGIAKELNNMYGINEKNFMVHGALPIYFGATFLDELEDVDPNEINEVR